MAFDIHPDLVRDTIELTRWPLCRVGLMNDRTYPWLILSPMLPGLRDFHDVPAAWHRDLMGEIGRASRVLQALYKPAKLNVAALGNATPQLHIHVIARQTTDPAWPRPVWGAVPTAAYEAGERAATVERLTRALADHA